MCKTSSFLISQCKILPDPKATGKYLASAYQESILSFLAQEKDNERSGSFSDILSYFCSAGVWTHGPHTHNFFFSHLKQDLK